MATANIDIRTMLFQHEIKQWQLAAALGVSEGVICKELRTEICPEGKFVLGKTIEAIVNGTQSPTWTDYKLACGLTPKNWTAKNRESDYPSPGYERRLMRFLDQAENEQFCKENYK